MSCARRHSTNVCPGNRVRYILCSGSDALRFAPSWVIKDTNSTDGDAWLNVYGFLNIYLCFQ